MKRSGLRLIRDGRVKFGGKWYVPEDREPQYDGSLDGTKWFFISYLPTKDMLAMWGDERAYREPDSRHDQANIDEQGYINWYFWVPQEQPPADN